MSQTFTLSRVAIRELYETNQMAKQSFDSYFIFPNGLSLPRRIGRRVENQRTIIESDNIGVLFRELRLDGEDSAIYINPDGVFKGMGRVTMVVGLLLEDDDSLYVITEPSKVTDKYFKDFGDIDKVVSKLDDGNYKIHIGAIIRNMKNDPSYRFIKRYTHEFNSETVYDGETDPVYIPTYVKEMTEEEVVNVYDKVITNIIEGDLFVIALKPFFPGISRKSKMGYTYVRHDRKEHSFAAYFYLSKVKGIRAHHKFEAIDMAH